MVVKTLSAGGSVYLVVHQDNPQAVKHVHHSKFKPVPPNLCPQEPLRADPGLHINGTEDEATPDGITQVNSVNCDNSLDILPAVHIDSGPRAPRMTTRVTAGLHSNPHHLPEASWSRVDRAVISRVPRINSTIMAYFRPWSK